MTVTSSSLRLKNILKEGYSGLLFNVVIKHWPKRNNFWSKKFISPYRLYIVHHWSKSEQEFKPEIWRQELKQNNGEYCLLACFSHLLNLLSHINQEPPAQRVAPPTTRLNIPNAPQMCTQAIWWRKSIKVPSRLHLGYNKVTKTTQQKGI